MIIRLLLLSAMWIPAYSSAQETGVAGLKRGNDLEVDGLERGKKLEPAGISSGPPMKVLLKDQAVMRKLIPLELSKYFLKRESYWEASSLKEDFWAREDQVKHIQTEQGTFLNAAVLKGKEQHVQMIQISAPMLGYHPQDPRSPKEWSTEGVSRTYTCRITYFGHRTYQADLQKWTDWNLKSDPHMPNELIVDFMQNGDCIVRYPWSVTLKAIHPNGDANSAAALEAVFDKPAHLREEAEPEPTP